MRWLYRRLTNRCVECGRKRIQWGYLSGAWICLMCDTLSQEEVFAETTPERLAYLKECADESKAAEERGRQ